jgi:aspartyl-tRNA(Asn)/glutamyl-tRNA(Gln) amidotransferase subunit C
MSESTDVMREDEAKGMLPKEEALKNAPDANSDYFRVPKFGKKV